jgi:ATP-dependent exoDNAse (exonuclease V) alpha subunit
VLDNATPFLGGPDVETLLYVCDVGAHVMLHLNLCSAAGLVNGASGIVKDIVHKEGATIPYDLPLFIMVNFPTYTGPSFFPNNPSHRTWVPIPRFQATYTELEGGEFLEMSREMMPLKLAWAWTIWKAQGQTFFGKVIVNLCKNDEILK